MLVDPFTIIAQVVNFLVLAAVLKYVLYDRIVAVIDRRQARIDQRIEDAEARESAAAEEERRYHQRRKALEDDRGRLLAEAREDADRQGRQLLADTRDEVEHLRAQWLAGVERERGRILAELERHAAREAIALGEQTLRDLADVQLEEQVVAVALQRLWDRRDDLVAELGGSSQVTVHTAFSLDEVQRRALTERLHGLLGDEFAVAFEPAPDLVCGLELRAGDHAFGWNVRGHLDALRRRVDTWLDEELQVDAPGSTEPVGEGTGERVPS